MSESVCSVFDFNSISREKAWTEYIYDSDNDEFTDPCRRCVMRFANMRCIGNCMIFDNNAGSKMYIKNVKHVIICEQTMIGTVFQLFTDNGKSITLVAR